MKKKSVCCILAVVTGNFLFAQESFLKKEKEIVISVGPTATNMKNSNINKDEYKNVDKQGGIAANFSYNKYFKNRIGFGIGVGYSNYKQTVYQKGLFQKNNLFDKDNYVYDSWVNSDIKYTTNLKYLDVPITLHVLLGKSKTFYGFIDAGLVNGFLIEGKDTKNGTIENMGKYPTPYGPDVSIVDQNDPYLDYKKMSFDKEFKENYKFHNPSFHASFGIVAAMTEKISLRVAPAITFGLSDITGKDDKGKDYENVFNDKSAYKPTKTFSMGLNVGLAFNL